MVLELDPREPSLCIGPRNRTGGSQELWQRAVLRIPLHSPPADLEALYDGLGEAREPLLDRVIDGYRAEILWSGDFIGHWSEDALLAVDALVEALGGVASLE